MLSAANRAARSDDIEEQLVRLRYDAFSELPAPSGLDSWPPPAPDDLFPDAGFAEVDARDFSAETLRSGILGHGCLAVRGLVSPARVAQLTESVDAAMNACEEWESSDRSVEAAPWFVPFDRENPSLSDGAEMGDGWWGSLDRRLAAAMFDVLEAFAEIGLDGPLTGYLGERPALSVKKWTLRRVPVSSGTNWHQDGAFLGEGIRTVNCWLTLSHCGDDAPGLDIVPKRLDSILPTGTDGAIFDWSVGEGVVERAAARRAGHSSDIRSRRRALLRRTLSAPHRGERRNDSRALRDRVVVLRSLALSRATNCRWCSEPRPGRRPATGRPSPQIRLR